MAYILFLRPVKPPGKGNGKGDDSFVTILGKLDLRISRISLLLPITFFLSLTIYQSLLRVHDFDRRLLLTVPQPICTNVPCEKRQDLQKKTITFTTKSFLNSSNKPIQQISNRNLSFCWFWYRNLDIYIWNSVSISINYRKRKKRIRNYYYFYHKIVFKFFK